ncbi:MAG: hypothetical protein KJZ65_11055 [Phycisphaerales bacterium]|nr:hypothetical protein [Phycisphaerales bacterium]
MSKTILGALALVAIAGVASADVIMEDNLQFAGHIFTDVHGNTHSQQRGTPITIYSNTSSAANAATSSLNLNTRWGDTLNMTGTGVLDAFSLTVFNSASGNTGVINTYDVDVRFYRISDSSFIGGFIGQINFGISALSPGYYSVVTFTGLSGFGINLDTANILATQARVAHTGGSIRMGVASLSPVTIGSSPVSFYKDDPSSPPAGFYVFSGGATPADLGYRVDVIPAPGAFALLGLGGLVATRRRR